MAKKSSAQLEVIVTAGSLRATRSTTSRDVAIDAARTFAKGNAVDGAEVRIESFTSSEGPRQVVSHYKCYRGAWCREEGEEISGLRAQASLF